MAKMLDSLRDWNAESFEQTFKSEMEGFRKDVLPLDDVIDDGNTVYDGDLGVTVIEFAEGDQFIEVRAGVYFAEIVSCCSCGESPPIDEAYCEMNVRINKSTAEAEFAVIKD
ncbi:MAG: glucosamine--fructose-6-phosphate aminotransferase [Pseudomonadota bacterium]